MSTYDNEDDDIFDSFDIPEFKSDAERIEELEERVTACTGATVELYDYLKQESARVNLLLSMVIRINNGEKVPVEDIGDGQYKVFSQLEEN